MPFKVWFLGPETSTTIGYLDPLGQRVFKIAGCTSLVGRFVGTVRFQLRFSFNNI